MSRSGMEENRAQYVKEWGVGTGEISWKAIALQALEALTSGRGFDLSDQTGFANPCFPAQQGDLSPAALCLLHTLEERCEVWGATDQDGANDWLIE